LWILTGLVAGLIAGLPTVPATDEYQVKAAFLYNFAKFVEWPPQVFNGAGDPIAICLFGQNPFGTALEEAVKDKFITGRTLVVREVSDFRKTPGCQILFVSSSAHERWRATLAGTTQTGMLTVGDTEGFAEEGGMVNFKLDGGKIRIQVNVNAAERAQVRISSKLLMLAEIVKQTGK
jgi:hypothetical protein